MTNQEAIENLRELGRIFADSIKAVTGKDVNKDSDLSNGLVAYEYLNLRGQWAYIDESVDIVLRIMYKEFIERH